MTEAREVPVLQAGDNLRRAEFERRYAATPRLKKAELLDGIVFVSSPTGIPHGAAHSLLAAWATLYAAEVPGLVCLTDATVRLDEDNEPQPDLLLRRDHGGSSRIDTDRFVAGPPELCVEVAASSVSYDLHQKLAVYRRAGVREYLVLRALDAAVDWFALRGGRYVAIRAVDGVVRSEQFPGLWLDVAALLRSDFASMRRTLELGLQTPAFAAFRDSLAT